MLTCNSLKTNDCNDTFAFHVPFIRFLFTKMQADTRIIIDKWSLATLRRLFAGVSWKLWRCAGALPSHEGPGGGASYPARKLLIILAQNFFSGEIDAISFKRNDLTTKSTIRRQYWYF